jgi:hypothetical protein
MYEGEDDSRLSSVGWLFSCHDQLTDSLATSSKGTMLNNMAEQPLVRVWALSRITGQRSTGTGMQLVSRASSGCFSRRVVSPRGAEYTAPWPVVLGLFDCVSCLHVSPSRSSLCGGAEENGVRRAVRSVLLLQPALPVGPVNVWFATHVCLAPGIRPLNTRQHATRKKRK